MRVGLVFLTFFIWSASFTIGRATLEYSPPLFLTGFRMVLAGVLLLLFLLFFKRKAFRIKKEHLLPLLLLSLSSVYITNALEFWGLQYLTSAKACLLYSLSPFLSTLISYFQFKEKITLKKMLGLSIGFLGFFPVLLHRSNMEELVGGVALFSWPEMALMGAVLASVYGWILLRKLGKEEGVSPLFANGFSMFLGGIFALLHSFLIEKWTPVPVSTIHILPFLQGVVLMIIVSNLICYNLYGYLLKRFTATFLSFAGLTTPLFAAFFGWVFLKEAVPVTFFLSTLIILAGLWLVYDEELRLGYIIKKKALPKKII